MKIQLIGKPAIVGAIGEPNPVRGHQAWALLARVVLSKLPLDRRGLAFDLFPDANDPQGALRWCLANLRRALNAPGALAGDPIQPHLPEGTSIDVLELPAMAGGDGPLGNLLEGIEPRCSPQFSTWLLVERARVASLVDERLRQEVMQALSARDFTRAINFASLAARRNPFDESAQILLVKSLSNGGMRDAAVTLVEDTERMFLAEIGEKPSQALRSALTREIVPSSLPFSTASVKAMIEAGRATVQVGVADSGLELLRQAASDAEALKDRQLQAEAMVELGTALVHAVRGFDDEGAILLGAALELSKFVGNAAIAAAALRELGYVDTLAGRRPSAASQLGTALELATPLKKAARIHAVMAFNLVSWDRFEQGLAKFDEAIDLARAESDVRTEIWALGTGSWGQLAAGNPEAASDWSSRCLDKISQSSWLAFRPFPIALSCEAKLLLGQDPKALRSDLEASFAHSCQMRDPCWEGAVARAIGLTYAVANDLPAASDWLASAQKRCARETDTLMALQVQILADRSDLSRRLGHASQAEWMTRELLAMAARTHADHHVQRAIDHLRF